MPRKANNHESKIYGVRAVNECFSNRPDDMVKIYLTRETAVKLEKILHYFRSTKRAFKFVETTDLQKLSNSTHHEGVVAVVRNQAQLGVSALISKLVEDQASNENLILCLDGVENPHNLGSIIRTAAFFGVSAVLVAGAEFKSLPASTIRTAEGAAEHIYCEVVDDLEEILEDLKHAGFTVVVTSPHAKTELTKFKFTKRTAIVFGSEAYGVSRKIVANSDAQIRISGSGRVESLNVSHSVAAVLAVYSSKIGV